MRDFERYPEPNGLMPGTWSVKQMTDGTGEWWGYLHVRVPLDDCDTEWDARRAMKELVARMRGVAGRPLREATRAGR